MARSDKTKSGSGKKQGAGVHPAGAAESSPSSHDYRRGWDDAIRGVSTSKDPWIRFDPHSLSGVDARQIREALEQSFTEPRSISISEAYRLGFERGRQGLSLPSGEWEINTSRGFPAFSSPIPKPVGTFNAYPVAEVGYLGRTQPTDTSVLLQRVLDLTILVENQAGRLRQLSADAHEFMWQSTLQSNLDEVPRRQVIPVRVVLSDEPGEKASEIRAAVEDLLNAIGFEITDDFPPVLGSWIKSWFAKSREIATVPEVAERLEKIERAIQLKGLGLPQAQIDEKQAAAVARLLKAVEGIPQAAMQVGSVLVLKSSTPKGPVLQVRTLTQQELCHLENNRHLLNSPAELVESFRALQAISTPGKIDGEPNEVSANTNVSPAKSLKGKRPRLSPPPAA